MRYLLDTHVWLWLQVSPDRVSESLREQLADPANDLRLSAASSWEIAIKYVLGKLSLPEVPGNWIPRQMHASGTAALPIEHSHAQAVAELPQHHRDPFDRLIIAQAKMEGLSLVSSDGAFDAYDVDLVRVG